MQMFESRPPVTPGESAPNFSLPAVDGAGSVSLADYRGRSPVFLALMVGLWCPFCRRHIAQMGKTEDKLKTIGVETLGVVATPADNARLYFKFRPTRLRLGTDPELSTHRAYGLPRPVPNGEFMEAVSAVRVNPFGDLPEPLPVPEASHVINAMDKYEPTATDQADLERQDEVLVNVLVPAIEFAELGFVFVPLVVQIRIGRPRWVSAEGGQLRVVLAQDRADLRSLGRV